MSTDPQCVFCKIVAGQIPAAIVHQSEQACAFLDIHPLAPGHLVVVPREHHATLTDLSPEAASSFFAELPRLARALLAATGVSDFNLLQNNGAAAGQEVSHFHVHLIPRVKNDGLGFRWNTITYLPGQDQALAEKIRSASSA